MIAPSVEVLEEEMRREWYDHHRPLGFFAWAVLLLLVLGIVSSWLAGLVWFGYFIARTVFA